MVPSRITRSTTALTLSWPNGDVTEIRGETLRRSCPCAECREQRGDHSHASPLTPKKSLLRVVEATKDEASRIEAVWGVGSYAIGVKFGDGHATGIFTFGQLASLARDTTSAQPE